MPKRPQGQKRPADVIGNAVRVMEIATGQRDEEFEDDSKDPAAKALGAKGGRARAAELLSKVGDGGFQAARSISFSPSLNLTPSTISARR